MTTLGFRQKLEHRILDLRGHKVMLDSDLAVIYGVSTKRLNQQVRRNLERFPLDFMFQVSAREAASLRLQFATLKPGRGRHRKYLPYAFTEHGAVMLASVLNSHRAVEMSLYVVRAFVKLRELAQTHKDILAKMAVLERKYDRQFRIVFEAIRELLGHTKDKSPVRIGFQPSSKGS